MSVPSVLMKLDFTEWSSSLHQAIRENGAFSVEVTKQGSKACEYVFLKGKKYAFGQQRDSQDRGTRSRLHWLVSVDTFA